jgi:hypothetical protein
LSIIGLGQNDEELALIVVAPSTISSVGVNQGVQLEFNQITFLEPLITRKVPQFFVEITHATENNGWLSFLMIELIKYASVSQVDFTNHLLFRNR